MSNKNKNSQLVEITNTELEPSILGPRKVVGVEIEGKIHLRIQTLVDSPLASQREFVRHYLKTLDHLHKKQYEGILYPLAYDEQSILEEFPFGVKLEDVVRTFPSQAGIGLAPTIRIIEGIIRPLRVLHAEKMNHGRLQPSNIYYSVRCKTTIAEWGLLPACLTLADQDPLSDDPYRAPELTKESRLNPGNDIYSIGVIFFELITGEKYKAESAFDHKLMQALYEVDSTGDLAYHMLDIARELLSQSPEKRMNTADELWNSLKSFVKKNMLGFQYDAARQQLDDMLRAMVQDLMDEMSNKVKALGGDLYIPPVLLRTSSRTQIPKLLVSKRLKSLQMEVGDIDRTDAAERKKELDSKNKASEFKDIATRFIQVDADTAKKLNDADKKHRQTQNDEVPTDDSDENAASEIDLSDEEIKAEREKSKGRRFHVDELEFTQEDEIDNDSDDEDEDEDEEADDDSENAISYISDWEVTDENAVQKFHSDFDRPTKPQNRESISKMAKDIASQFSWTMAEEEKSEPEQRKEKQKPKEHHTPTLEEQSVGEMWAEYSSDDPDMPKAPSSGIVLKILSVIACLAILAGSAWYYIQVRHYDFLEMTGDRLFVEGETQEAIKSWKQAAKGHPDDLVLEQKIELARKWQIP